MREKILRAKKNTVVRVNKLPLYDLKKYFNTQHTRLAHESCFKLLTMTNHLPIPKRVL